MDPNVEKWDRRFLNLAKEISSWSLDPSTQVGAIIAAEDKSVVSLGYNGFPRKLKDDSRLSSREEKLKIMIHAEVNSILASKRSLEDCTLYTFPFMPCSICASIVIQSGITRVVSFLNNNPRWIESFNLSNEIFKEANVEVFLYV